MIISTSPEQNHAEVKDILKRADQYLSPIFKPRIVEGMLESDFESDGYWDVSMDARKSYLIVTRGYAQGNEREMYVFPADIITTYTP